MKFGKSIFAIASAGILAVVIGLYIRTLDVGSCPMIPSGSTITGCYHTFQNSSIYIYPTGTFVIEFALALLIAAFILGLYADT
jgi:hypothetical protein